MQLFASVSEPQIRHWLGRHLLFWVVVDIAVWIAHSASISRPVERLQTTLLMQPFNMVLVYMALYWLLPLMLTNQYRRFGYRLLLYLSGSWALTFLYRGYVLVPFRTGKTSLFPNYHEVFSTGGWLVGLLIAGVSVGITLYRLWYQREEANRQLVHETLTIELQVLKAQVHPHFLFNTLNNLYSLTLRQSPLAPDMIGKLSWLMNFIVHDCNAATIPLATEIEFLRNYIELEKLRYGSRLVISLTIDGQVDRQFIAPLLLIPFVENAFKHGASQQIGQATVDLALSVTDHILRFRLENSKEPQSPNLAHRAEGIGLSNVRKRLALLYPNAYELKIQPEARKFRVELTIDSSRQYKPVSAQELILPVTN